MSVSRGLDPAPYGSPELAALAAAQAAKRDPAADNAQAQRREDRQLAESLLWQRHFEQRDLQAREELILLHMPYAKAVAGGLYRQHSHHETEFLEYVQLATLGLIEALDRYDPGRGAQFKTYAHARMLGAIRSGLEHLSERQEQIALNRKLTSERMAAVQRGQAIGAPGAAPESLLRDMADLGASMVLTFMLEDTAMLQSGESALPDGCYESLVYKNEQQRVRDLVGQLTPREQSVVRLHYLQGLRFNDIADTLGITRGRVSQLHEQALARLRKLVAC